MIKALPKSQYSKEYIEIQNLLNKEKNYSYLIDLIIYLITPEEELDYKAAHILGCTLPFYLSLPLYIITYPKLTASSFKWWQLVNQTRISSTYIYLINNPSLDNLFPFTKQLQLSSEMFNESLSVIERVGILLNDSRYQIDNNSKEI